MLAAREADITSITFDPVTSIPILITKVVESNPVVFYYKESTRNTISQGLIEDPYEKKMVYVAPSKIDGAGDGYFIRKAGRKGSIVGFYNGIKIGSIEPGQSWIERKSPYRMDNDWAVANEVIDIPEYYR